MNSERFKTHTIKFSFTREVRNSAKSDFFNFFHFLACKRHISRFLLYPTNFKDRNKTKNDIQLEGMQLVPTKISKESD